MSTRAGATTTSGMSRYGPAVVLGAIAGIPLGLWTGSWASAPGWDSLAVVFPIGITGAIIVAWLVAAALTRNGSPVVAAIALSGTFCLGALVAPGASGSTQSASGTGTAGTRADAAALWSGPVTCEWPKGEAAAVEQVRGFDVPISDTLLAAEGLKELEPLSGLEPLSVTIVNVDGSVYYEAEGFGGEFGVELEEVSADGRTGTAVTRDGDVVFHWICSGGP
jgi:hypothetical protein